MMMLKTYVFSNQYLGGDPGLSTMFPRHIYIMEVSLARFFNSARHVSEYIL